MAQRHALVAVLLACASIVSATNTARSQLRSISFHEAPQAREAAIIALDTVSLPVGVVMADAAADTLLERSKGRVVSLAHWATIRISESVANLKGLLIRHQLYQQPVTTDTKISHVDEAEELVVVTFKELFISAVITGIIATIVAYLYKKNKVPASLSGSGKADDLNKNWSTGTLDPQAWMAEPWLCFWACCCPAIRWADSMSMLGLLGFWVAFSIFLGLELLNSLTSGVVFYLVLCSVATYQRQRLREKFDMDHDDAKTVGIDCLWFCCCLPCAVSQEARHVEEAAKQGHPAVDLPEETA